MKLGSTQDVHILDRGIDVALTALAFLLPIFFLPITTEFYEFNKLVLLIVGSMLIFAAWIAKLFLNKKVYAIRSPLNLALLAFAIVFILSTVFSINSVNSIYGRYGVWFPSLFGLGALIALYYSAAINTVNMDTAKKAITAFGVGAALSSLIALLSYFEVYISSELYARIPTFSLTGSPNSAAVVAALGLIVALFKLLNTKALPARVFWIQVVILNFAIVALFNVLAAWVVLLTGIVSLVAMTGREQIKESRIYLLVIGVAAVALMVATVVPQSRSAITNENFSRELTLSMGNSWVVSSSTVTDFPPLGTGPGTFDLNFTRYRPQGLNTIDAWNIRFTKPANELLNVVSDLGIIGTIAYIYLLVKVVSMVRASRKYEDATGAMQVLGSLIMMLVVLQLFAPLNVMYAGLLFIFVGLLTAAMAASNDQGEGSVDLVQIKLSSLSSRISVSAITDESTKNAERDILYIFAVVPLILYVAFVGYFYHKQYLAEYYLRQSVVASQQNNGIVTYENQQRAIMHMPRRAEYRNAYAQTNLLLASSLSTNENLSEQDRINIQTLVSQAIRESIVSTEELNPLAVGSWEIRANIYRALIGIAANSEQWSLAAYDRAAQLEPTNPRLRLEAGGIYFMAGDYASAANLFRQATNLKPDYANAHYNLGKALQELGNYSLALREMEFTLRLLPPDAADVQTVLKDIEALTALAQTQAQQAQQQQMDVEALEQEARVEEQGVTQQGPLTQPGQSDGALNPDAGAGIEETLNEAVTPDQEAQPEGTGENEAQDQ